MLAGMWSYVLSAVGITGLLIAARRPRVGWWLNIAAQGLWATYAAVTAQWGFLLSAAVYGFAYARLLRRAAPAAVPAAPAVPAAAISRPRPN